MDGEVKSYDSAGEEEVRCAACGVALEPRKVTLHYLGYQVTPELPCCPKCGQVYLSEALSKGRGREVEMMLEDK